MTAWDRAEPFGLTFVASQTWLAQPCTLFVSVRSSSGSGVKRAAELDDIAIAVVPLVEQGEILGDVVDRRHERA